MGFSDAFRNIDEKIFNVLGDDILVTPKGGEEVSIKAPFYMVHNDEEMLNRIDETYPHLKDVKSVDLHLFKKGTLVKVLVDGVQRVFQYQTKNPNGANTWEIELRNEVKTW